MTKLSLHPGCYPSRKGFRPVVRVYRDGKPSGSKASPHLFPTRAEADDFARNGANVVALNMHDPEGRGLTVSVQLPYPWNGPGMI